MKRRLVGVLLLLPLIATSIVAAPTCERGRVGGGGGGYGELMNNLLAAGFMLGLVMAAGGLALIFGKPKQ